jgi:hypothetical protein
MNDDTVYISSPNSDEGVDAIINVMCHELAEACSDPLLNNWYVDSGSKAGYENADLCAWQFPDSQDVLVSGIPPIIYDYRYNLVACEKKYLVQSNWIPKTGPCQMSP